MTFKGNPFRLAASLARGDGELAGGRIALDRDRMWPSGSLLNTVSVADLGPKLVGAKRMGNGREAPPPGVNGNDKTCGTRNSPEDDVMPVTKRGQLPPLFKSSGSTTKEPTQTLPRLPEFAIARFSRGAGHRDFVRSSMTARPKRPTIISSVAIQWP
jgi:hypothetical protein